MTTKLITRPKLRRRFNMSVQELDAAIAAASEIAKIVCMMKGENSHDCHTAWDILTEMRSEVASRQQIA